VLGLRAQLFAAPAVLGAVLALAACGGEDETSMRATLTDEGCTYEGDTTPPPGMFTIEVENQTEHFGAFAVASLAGNATVEDLKPVLEQAQETFEETGSLPDMPAYYEQVVRGAAQAGESTFLPVDVGPADTPSCVSWTTCPRGRHTPRRNWTLARKH
jgi:hypothetical protein